MGENLSPLVTTLPSLLVIDHVEKEIWRFFLHGMMWRDDQAPYDFVSGSP